MDYSIPAPPFTKNDNYLSAYWINQLSQYVNNAADVVYGVNTFQWTYAASIDIAGLAGMYVLQHKYPLLKVAVRVEDDCTVHVRLSKRDDYVATTEVYTNDFSTGGDYTISIDLSTSPGGFNADQDGIYFCYVEFDKASPGAYLQWIKYVYEQGNGLIVPPSPALPTLSTSTVIDDVYLNKLVTAAKGLGQYTHPYSIPFAGIKSQTSLNQDNTFLRWRALHLHRYIHMGFIPAISGGGADGVEVYLNNQVFYQCANDSAKRDLIFDTTALPGGITPPAAGAEYEIKIACSRDNGAFRMLYLWELPYL